MSAERDPVMPVTRYCDILWQWLDLVCKRAEEDDARSESDNVNYGHVTDFQKIRDLAPRIRLAIQKSNYLYRRIYLGEEHRTEPCPKHKGHWSGYADPYTLEPCPYGCSLGIGDITGWLPAHPLVAPEGEP